MDLIKHSEYTLRQAQAMSNLSNTNVMFAIPTNPNQGKISQIKTHENSQRSTETIPLHILTI